MIDEYEHHIGRMGRMYLRDKSYLEGIILNEKNGQITFRSNKNFRDSLNTIDTTMISRIYSEPLIILSEGYSSKR